ncbi:hypothetical protein Mapa_002539 [Marchantia paleacea]|nr:hypothetical protein Mapa_002539 [Marchantia paleacea]
MSSSVQVEHLTNNRFPDHTTSMAPYQILLKNETALSCAKLLEIPVQASTREPPPEDAKDLPKMELDRSADDVDHGSPLRMRAVLRSLFKAAEPLGSSPKDPNLVYRVTLELSEHLGGTGVDDIRSERDDDFSSAVTYKLMKTDIAEENRQQEELDMLKDEGRTKEGSVSTELDLGSRGEVHDVSLQEEKFPFDNSVDYMNLTMENTEEEASSPSKDTKSSSEPAEVHSKPLKVFPSFQFTGLNHVAFCCENLEKSLDFYCGLLGLTTSPDRPELPYRGAWLLLGAEGIHIMEVPNPDPVHGRPGHGGFDRHACLNCKNVEGLRQTLEKAGIPYQLSMVPSIFCRDPDGNGLEFIEISSLK